MFRVLEAELGRDADLHREAELARQDLVRELECHLGLRMQRGRHVDRVGIALGALEPYILGAGVGADALEEVRQPGAGPRADLAPALDADVAGDLLLLRHRVELRQGPRLLVVDPAAHPELVALALPNWRPAPPLQGI